ncbi:flagellar filament capping protein FliD [Silvanigrella paludirubra]|uniref:Flagellar hook-associated protein 2 n=1 Tax=Silvanigrella paludirubra TaxID=2499159 RepID=A0A6N6VX28_9BACT|nr:flagellar filament capping protein FliD [Silvanigrella paludirubra]KAB8038007.1 flagellar filament capping protein FliD [Silvanigrella paludirubra]
MAGIRINTGSGIDPKMVDQLVEIEREPIKQVEARKKTIVDEQKLFSDLKGLVSTLGSTLNGMRTKADFYKLKLTSSHPDIIEGTVDNNAPIGSYELEVRHLARSHKLLTQSFEDKDKTAVGFGYMTIEKEDGESFDVDIDPDRSTLNDVATQINSMDKGVKAIVINTKEGIEDSDEENYRLLVLSEKSGKEAKVTIDPDTTYLEFKEQITGRNLEMLFEDVKVYNETNKVTELFPGMVLDAKKAEPGTKVNIKIDYDVDKSLENVKKFVESYNKVNEFIEKQFQVDPNTNKAGVLSKDNSLRTLRRTLQSAIQFSLPTGKYQTLADVGISTDPKTGNLKYDETKAKQALSEDYVGVSKLFIQSDETVGIGIRMSDSVRNLQSQQSGVLPSKDREYKHILENFDKDIAVKNRYAKQKEESIRHQFAVVEQLISGMNAQGQVLQQRLGGMG